MDLRRWRRPRGWRLVALAVAVVVLLTAVAAVASLASRPAPISARNLTISVMDGPRGDQHVRLDATFFLPAGRGRVPAILLAHGFGETKNAVRPQAQDLARDGFAVLTWSARGFGRSTGQIALDSPDYEVKDVEQLVTWLSQQPRVRLDHPGDPRVGIAGASYGGGIALLAAAYDHRIDAIAPQITWNNLATALFPNAAGGAPIDGVFKKQWAGLLFGAGGLGAGELGAGAPGAGNPSTAPAASPQAGGTAASAPEPTAPGRTGSCGRFLPAICAIYQRAATLGRATPQAIATLERSSPSSVARRIDVPTLLIQGEHDSLFGLDQASANYRAIHRNGAPVAMVWFAGGHDGGNQETSRTGDLTAQWFDRWLKPRRPPWHPGQDAGQVTAQTGDTAGGTVAGQTGGTGGGTVAGQGAAGQPGFAVSRDLGFDASSGMNELGVASAAAFPGLGGTTRTLVRLDGPPQAVANPPGGAPPSISSFAGLGTAGGLTLTMPGQSAAFSSAPLRSPLQITGAPVVHIRVSGAPQVTLFAALYDVDQAGNATLPFQLVAPLRVSAPADGGAGAAGDGTVVTVQLPAIDYQVAAGHRLRLVLTTTDFGYATTPDPATYQVSMAGAGVTVPADPALQVSSGGLPWWTWGAPLGAALAAAVILATGRRRRGRRDRLAPLLTEVPLDISGLTKRFRDGQLAVDDLSLRVERQQILGLLGPNGAGKTTTLRALMGLIQPDAGTITIFGQEVHAGSPALSRLGAFVEGPGFLPHLSGRANLDMYWRATGRPADGAGLADVLAIAGLGQAVDRPVRTYSRGMRQRLAIAQAMLGLPELLVLDEPMNGLDPPQIREMRDVLTRYATAGRTIILSSHMLAEVELTCTDVVVMHLGRGIAAGSVSEIAGDGGAVIIGTSDPDRACQVLAGLPGIEAVDRHPDGVLLKLGDTPAAAAVAALVHAGLEVDRVMPHRRLEDAFLALIAGSTAAGTTDAGGADAGTTDAGTTDAGTTDAGATDGPAGAGAAGLAVTDSGRPQ
jgi:ABC-2 type transport system ATP-binding protein